MGISRLELSCGLQPIHNRHGNIDYKYVRVKGKNRGNRLPAVFHHRNHFTFFKYCPADIRRHRLMVIGDYNSDLSH